MKRILTILAAFAVVQATAQVTFNKQAWEPVERAATVNFSELDEDYAASLLYLEAPTPDGDSYRSFLLQEKAKIAELYPKNPSLGVANRGTVEPPHVLAGFEGNNSTSNTPMDNNLAINNEGQMVSVINSHIAMKDIEGNWIGAATLNNFFSDLNIDIFKFDPKVVFDPEANRFVMFCLSGSSSATNSILVAFSQSPDPTGDWNLYVIDGTPFNDNTWTDYPMLALTKDEIFLTGNLVIDGASWQVGFAETLCWQINKNNGYNGEPLTLTMWSDFEFGGMNIRNVCPVKYGGEELGEKLYLLSNRNFAMENDSIFIMEITGPQTDPNTTLNIDVRKSSQPYGLAPDGSMTVGSLATNDSRILDGIILDDHLQFVSNCRNLETGMASVYHGWIDNLTTTKDVSGQILNGDTLDLGYPSIAWAGLDAADKDAIIVLSHSSVNRFPGASALYVDNDHECSPIVTLKEGNNYIAMLQGQGQERWGDYSGNQRVYDEPGTVWISSSFGESNQANDTWISQLANPNLGVAVTETTENLQNLNAFPNPTSERINVTFDIKDVEKLHITLTDQNGRLIRSFHNDKPKKQGAIQFSFDVSPLPAGVYFVNVIGDGVAITAKKVVVQ